MRKTRAISWWAREDSNLQPSGYERATLPGKVSVYWHFRAVSMMFVRDWLRRIIGYPLVGGVPRSSNPANWQTQSGRAGRKRPENVERSAALTARYGEFFRNQRYNM